MKRINFFESNTKPAIGFFLYMLILPFYWSNFSFLIIVAVSALAPHGHNGKINKRIGRVNLSVIVFATIFAISILASDTISTSLRFSAAWPSCLIIYYVVATQLDYQKDWQLFCLSFSLCAFFSSLLCILGFYFNYGMSPSDTIDGIRSPLFIVPNDTIFLSLVAPLSISILTTSKQILIRLVAAASILTSLVVVIAVESRTALIVAIVCVAAYIWNYRSRHIVIYLSALIAAIVTVDAILGFPIYQKLPVIPSSRIPLLHSSLVMWEASPLIGGGPFTFAAHYQRFLEGVTYPSWVVVDTREIPWPHNLYLELLSGSGVLGLASFLSIIWFALSKLRSLKNQDGHSRVIMKALVALILGFLAAAVVETTLLRIWVLVLFFAIIGFIANMELKRI